MTAKRKNNLKTTTTTTNKTKCQKRKSSGFQRAVRELNGVIRRAKPDTLMKAARLAVKYSKTGKTAIRRSTAKPRIVSIPKTGGVLPLIPIFAALSALGALSGGAAGITKAVNDASAARKDLLEAQRHNRSMESIAMGKGVFLRQYKKGLGIFLGTNRSAAMKKKSY